MSTQDFYPEVIVPGKAPGLEFLYKHSSSCLNGACAIIWLRVVMPVPVVTLFHCEREGNIYKTDPGTQQKQQKIKCRCTNLLMEGPWMGSQLGQ